MKKWKPVLVLVLVFVAGLTVGVVATRVITRGVIRYAINHPDAVRDRIEHELVRKLKLTAEQRTKVHETLIDSQRQLGDLRVQFQPRFGLITSNAQARIAEVLTPEQQAKFDKLREENKRFFPSAASAH